MIAESGPPAIRRGLINWFARNHVAANLLMSFLVIMGLYGASIITLEIMPNFKFDAIDIRVPYLGAAPAEVEEGVVVKIEEVIESIEGVKQIFGYAMEGMGQVTVNVQDGFALGDVLDEVKFAVDSISIWYNNSRYPAVWDIILAARHDAELMASIRAWRVAAAKELDAAVVKLFPEFAFTPERLKNLQHFVTSHLRGVRFMRIYEDHRLEIDEQLRLLAEALRQMVEATPRK